MATKISWLKNSILPALIVGLLLRLPLMWQSLWYDEAFTLYLATLDIPRLVAATAGDVHPPLWYLLAWASCRVFGVNEFAVRLPALIFGLVTIPLFFYALRGFDGIAPRTTTIALWLVVTSPMLVNYSAEARMYSLLGVLYLLGILAAQRRNWWALGLIITAGMYTQNMFALALPLLALLAGLPTIIYAGLLSLALYAPWVPVVLSQTTNVHAAYWIPEISAGRVVYTVYRILTGPGHHEAVVLITAPLVLLIVALGVWQARNNWRLLAWALLPPTLAAVISIAQPVMIERILIGAVPGLLVMVALGVNAIITRLGRWYALTPALVWGIALASLFVTPTNADLRARYQTLNIQPGDTCYHLNASTLITVAYVHPQCRNYLWPAEQGLDQTITQATKQAMGMRQVDFEQLPAGAVWLFHYTGPHVGGAEFDEQTRILSKYPIIDSQLVQDDDGIALTTVWRINTDDRYASRK